MDGKRLRLTEREKFYVSVVSTGQFFRVTLRARTARTTEAVNINVHWTPRLKSQIGSVQKFRYSYKGGAEVSEVRQ